MALLVSNGFREDDFAHLHPGGQLGKRTLRVERLMHTGAEVPTATPPDTVERGGRHHQRGRIRHGLRRRPPMAASRESSPTATSGATWPSRPASRERRRASS